MHTNNVELDVLEAAKIGSEETRRHDSLSTSPTLNFEEDSSCAKFAQARKIPVARLQLAAGTITWL